MLKSEEPDKRALRSRFGQGLPVQNSVISLRRYPVKFMGGEALDVTEPDARSFVGDRWYAVEDEEGHFASGKDTRRFRGRDPVFDYAAHTEPDGRVVVTRRDSSWYIGDPDLDQWLSDGMGMVVQTTPEREVPHQDMGSVSIVHRDAEAVRRPVGWQPGPATPAGEHRRRGSTGPSSRNDGYSAS